MTAWSELAKLTYPGDSIREGRIDLGWTQAFLSERTGIPQADISRFENGHLDARWSTIRRICAALADGSDVPRRSLANGRNVAEIPATSSNKRSAKRPTVEISRATR